MQLAAAGSPDSTTYVKLPFKRLVAYATLQLPLNMAALPVVLNVPKFYGDALGLSFAALGTYLLLTHPDQRSQIATPEPRSPAQWNQPLFGVETTRCLPGRARRPTTLSAVCARRKLP